MLPPSKDDPFRPADWRWKRARYLCDTKRYGCLGRDDEDTLVIKRYLTLAAKMQDELELMTRAVRKFPGLYWADKIRDRKDSDIKWIIEARLLANEVAEDIAGKVGCSTEAVIWYEKAYFNVLPFLHRKDYIVGTVIGRSVQEGLFERDYDTLWKVLGYAYGPHMLDAIIHHQTNATHVVSPDQVNAARADAIKGFLAHKSVVSAITYPVAYNQNFILELWRSLLELEKDAGASGGTQAMIVNNIHSALLSLPFSVEQSIAIPELRFYDKQSAELRADELLTLAVKGDNPELRQAVTQPIGGQDGQPAQNQ